MSDLAKHHWRPMRDADRTAAGAIAAVIHADYPEDAFVLAERLRLYSAGCLTLDRDEIMQGYVVSHPWAFGAPPKLNTRLVALPQPATTYYIHDLALLPEARGAGVARAIVEHLAGHSAAAGFDNLSLVSVGNSAGFWRRCGFEAHGLPDLAVALQSYDATARYMVRRLRPQSQ